MNRFLRDQLSFSRTHWLVSIGRVYANLVLLLVCQAQEQGPSAQGTQSHRLSRNLNVCCRIRTCIRRLLASCNGALTFIRNTQNLAGSRGVEPHPAHHQDPVFKAGRGTNTPALLPITWPVLRGSNSHPLFRRQR